jgi:hypothetical protein
MSALLVCTASEANLLKNGAIVSVFEKGMEEDIIPALKDFSDREKSQTEVIDLLTQEIEAIRPNFVPGLVSSLRVGIISDDEPEQSNSTEPTQADPLVGWAGMVEPLLTKAIHHGFELSPIIATYQADVKIALKGERVSLADFIDIVQKMALQRDTFQNFS